MGKIRINERIYLLIIFCVLFLGLYSNIASKICNEGVSNFDWWSNDILISDMMYTDNYQIEGSFLYAITPPMISPQDATLAEGVLPEKFKNGDVFEKEMFKPYTSNIVAQRFIYRFLVRVVPISHSALLELLYVGNCILAAVSIVAIFYWIAGFSGYYIPICAAVILSFFCPYFAMYGKNLYWCMWSLFFPMSCMSVLVRKEWLSTTKNYLKAFVLWGIAFFSCAIKMLICFEFVTSVMIGMTIPLFFHCFREKYSLKKIFMMIFWPFLGAMMSFGVIYILKLWMLYADYGKEIAKEIIYNNLAMRIFGTVDTGVESLGPIGVSFLMLGKEYISIFRFFRINFLVAVSICILQLAILWKNRNIINRNYYALILSTVLSLLAAFSWYIMAAPHTTIHNQFATINWFIPFGILFIVTIGVTVKEYYVYSVKKLKRM